MAQNVTICEISDEVVQKLKKFRFRKEKDNAAIFLKIDTSTLTVILDEELGDTSIEEIQEELPDHQPRFIVLSYKREHDDGRVSYPLCYFYFSPPGMKPELNMMYAGTKTRLQDVLGVTKSFEVRDKEEFTDEWLNEKLSFFK